MKPAVTEVHIQQTIVEFLEYDGWRAIRTHPLPPIVQRMDGIMRKGSRVLQSLWWKIRPWVLHRADAESFGESGMPDYLFLRYWSKEDDYMAYLDDDPRDQAEVLWVEFKRKGAKPDPHQVAWHEAERARGALVMVVDDIDKAMEWYHASSLNRRWKK